MKSSKKLILFTILILTLSLLAGCTSNESENYGDMTDTEYLTGDYTDQLIRDGAETVIGAVELSESDGTYTVAVDEKKIIANSNYKEGYYIADPNVTSEYALASDIGVLIEQDGELSLCSAEDYIRDHSGDTETLYTVYVIGGAAQLILPLDPQAALNAVK